MEYVLMAIGVTAIGWYFWLAYLGYKACTRGGHGTLKALRWGFTWPIKAHMTIKNSYR